MLNIILALVIIAIIGTSIRKIVIEKKKGVKCIGCPSGGKSNCSCNTNKK